MFGKLEGEITFQDFPIQEHHVFVHLWLQSIDDGGVYTSYVSASGHKNPAYFFLSSNGEKSSEGEVEKNW